MRRRPLLTLAALLLGVGLAMGMVARAADREVQLHIRNHEFEPAEIKLPPGVKVQLVVTNDDATQDEFDCYELSRHKHIQPHTQVTLFLGPLQPGRYPFSGQRVILGLNPESGPGKGDASLRMTQAKGVIVVE